MILNKIIKKLIYCLPYKTRENILNYLITIQPQPSRKKHPLLKIHTESCIVIPDRVELLKKLSSTSCRVAEIGVLDGDFSELILKYCNPEELILIDVWEIETQMVNVQKRFILNKNVDIRKGNGANELGSFPDNYFDWVYIDTSHNYQDTMDELFISSKKIKTNGLICGHDYTQGNWDKRIKYGVIDAVHEFCVLNNYKFQYLSLDSTGYRSFALRKI